jgi:hypothetical protein
MKSTLKRESKGFEIVEGKGTERIKQQWLNQVSSWLSLAIESCLLVVSMVKL